MDKIIFTHIFYIILKKKKEGIKMKMERFRKTYKGNKDFGKDNIGIEVLEPVNENGDMDWMRYGILDIFINSEKVLSLYDWSSDILYDHNLDNLKVIQQLGIVYPVNYLLEQYSEETRDESGEIVEIDTDILNSPIYLKKALEDEIEDENLKNEIIKYTNIIKITEIDYLKNTKYYIQDSDTKEIKWCNIHKIEFLYIISNNKSIFLLYDKDDNIIGTSNLTGYSPENIIFKDLLDEKDSKSYTGCVQISARDLMSLQLWYSRYKDIVDSYIDASVSKIIYYNLKGVENHYIKYEEYELEWKKRNNIKVSLIDIYDEAHNKFYKHHPDYKEVTFGNFGEFVSTLKTDKNETIHAVRIDAMGSLSFSDMLYTTDGKRLLRCASEDIREVLNLSLAKTDAFIAIRPDSYNVFGLYEYYIDIDNTSLHPEMIKKIIENTNLSYYSILNINILIDRYEDILVSTIKKYYMNK